MEHIFQGINKTIRNTCDCIGMRFIVKDFLTVTAFKQNLWVGSNLACKDISVGFLQVCRLEYILLHFLDMKAFFTLIGETMPQTAFKIYLLSPSIELIKVKTLRRA
jgi:hypothetical protein